MLWVLPVITTGSGTRWLLLDRETGDRRMDRSHWLNSFEFLDKLAENLLARMLGKTTAVAADGAKRVKVHDA